MQKATATNKEKLNKTYSVFSPIIWNNWYAPCILEKKDSPRIQRKTENRDKDIKQLDRQAERGRDKQRDRDTAEQRQHITVTQLDRQRERERQTDRQTDMDKERDIERQRERETETERQTEK